MARRRETPDECSVCGAAVPPRALACPSCGADENTGWDKNPWLPDENELEVPDYLTEDFDPDRDGDLGIPGVAASRSSRILAAIALAIALLWVIYLITG